MTPPRTILLVNAGQRDIQVGGATLPQHTYRAETARLLDRVRAAPEDPHPDIGLPIVEVTVRAIISAGGAPIAVVVFGTDQADANYAHGDTVHAADLMATLLPTRFPADVITATGLPLRVAKANDHDDAYRAFRQAFREAKLTGAGGDARGPESSLAAILGDDPTVPITIAVSSGTPAANLGALLAAVETLGDRVHAIQPREDGSVARIDVAATIRRQALTQPARRLLREGQFATAAAFIEAWGDARAGTIARLCRALHRWQDYDLLGAIAEVRAVRTDLHTSVGAPIAALRDTAARMETSLGQRVAEMGPRPEPTLNQLVDLLWGADLCRAQGRLVDLVARAARFNEAMVRRTAKRTCGNVEAADWKRDAFWGAVWQLLGHRAEAFAARLAPYNRKASPWTWLVSVPNLLHLLDTLAEDPVAHPDLPAIATAARIVDVARPLHNQSIAGHAFAGVTDRAIRDLLSKDVPSLDDATRARLATDGEGGRIIVEAMARLLDAARLPAPRTNFFLDRYGAALADALVAIDP